MKLIEGPNAIAVVLVLLAAATSMLFTEYRYRQIRDELTVRPPIAVIPVDAIVVQGLQANPLARAEEQVQHVREIASRLATAGYVVLDQRVVYSYPTDVEVRP